MMHKILSLKSFIISMSLIFVLGLGFIVVFYFILYPQIPKESLISSLPVTKEPVSLSLIVSSPNNDSLVFDENLLISGKASPTTVVIIASEDDDLVINPKKDGTFSLTYKLSLGINNFIISAFDENGNNKQERRMVYYSKEKI